jgi:DNA invertase Pin-like site-specific DNA recombinase
MRVQTSSSSIEAGEADGILCWHLNRLFRNPVDQGTVAWMLQESVIRVIQTYDQAYLPEDNVLLFNVEGAMANQYIRDLAKTSRRGMQSKAEKGWLPSRAPLGYRNDLLTNEIYPDDERWDMVRKMWEMLLSGNYTVGQILRIANNEWGFRTPQFKRSGGCPIADSSIYRIFNNQFYTGAFEWAGTLYEGNHKPMITVDEYDKAQLILGRKGKPRKHVHESSFTGLVYCGECGSMCTCSVKQKIVKKTGELKTYAYYNCTKKKKTEGKKNVCTQRPLTLDEFESFVDVELERHTILPVFQEWAIEIINRKNDEEIRDRTKIYEQQQRTYNQTQKELDTLTQMRYRNLIEDDEFISQRTKLKKKMVVLKQGLESIECRAEKWLELTEQTFHFARYARKSFLQGTIQEKREIFAALGQNFTMTDKKVLITANDWFVPIENAYPALEAEFNRLELDKRLSISTRNEQIASLILTWGGYRE